MHNKLTDKIDILVCRLRWQNVRRLSHFIALLKTYVHIIFSTTTRVNKEQHILVLHGLHTELFEGSWTEYGLACMRNVSTYDRNWFLKRIQFILCPQNSRYLPPRMELLWRLLLLHKCRMLLLADRRSKLLDHEFKSGDSSQPRGKCLYAAPSQRRQILDWTQWPKRGGLLCVDKQRDK